jgi:hypothetical protein
MSDQEVTRWEVEFTVRRPDAPDVKGAFFAAAAFDGVPIEWQGAVGGAIARLVREADWRDEQALQDHIRLIRDASAIGGRLR